MDINKQIQEITDKVIDEKLPTMVEEAATKMLTSVISDVFSNYSTMAKEIKKKIEEKLDVNLQKFDLVDYNALVAKIINDNIIQQVNLQPILDLTKKALGFVNKTKMKLSEIVDLFKQASMEDSQESQGSISLFIEENEKHKWIEVYLDMEPEKKKENCSLHFLLSLDGQKTIFSFHCKDYWTNLNPITPAKLTNLSHLEAIVFRLYSAQVEIEVDEIDYNTEWDRLD
jgi:hypothetical protein